MTESSGKNQSELKPLPHELEIVSLDLAPECRLRLYNQIASQMDRRGHSPDYRLLGLGFELPPGWPVDKDALPTLAQLVVMALKLNMQIVIDDLNLEPLKESEAIENAYI